MKFLSLTAILLLLLNCKRDTVINPTTLTSFEYGVYWGFTGQVTKLTVSYQKQVLLPDTRFSRTCEATLSESDWSELTRLFNEDAFKKVKVGEPSTCPDAGAARITARWPSGAISAEWGPCSGGDPTGIQPLITALNKRLQAMQAICQ